MDPMGLGGLLTLAAGLGQHRVQCCAPHLQVQDQLSEQDVAGGRGFLLKVKYSRKAGWIQQATNLFGVVWEHVARCRAKCSCLASGAASWPPTHSLNFTVLPELQF